jgi:hypothetical protein
VVPFVDSEELVRSSGLPASAPVEVGNDHRLADPGPLVAVLGACERAAAAPTFSMPGHSPVKGKPPEPLARTPPFSKMGKCRRPATSA